MMTNLQTGHLLNNSKFTMKILVTSTIIATAFSGAFLATPAVAQMEQADAGYNVEDLERADLYVSEHGMSDEGLATIDNLRLIGPAQDVIVDDAARPIGVLVDLGTFRDEDTYPVMISVSKLKAISSGSARDAYQVVEPLTALLALPPYTGDTGTLPRAEVTEDVEREGTGLTTQSGPGNETPSTVGKGLEDAREPLAGDVDVQERIVPDESDAEPET